MEKGSLPGKAFGVCRVRAVRGGEVKRIFSLGSGTKVWGPSSMTQLLLSARGKPIEYFWWCTHFTDMLKFELRIRYSGGGMVLDLLRGSWRFSSSKGVVIGCCLGHGEFAEVMPVCTLIHGQSFRNESFDG